MGGVKMEELEQIEKFWLLHGEYTSGLEACKAARNEGYSQTTLAEMMILYRNLFGIVTNSD